MNPGNARRYTMLAPLLMALLLAGCQTVPIPDPAVRYIAFGDSTTADQADRQYWELLRDDLGLPANTFAGQGKGGETTSEGISRLQPLFDQGLYPNAQVLLYWEGGNDILDFVRNHDPLVALSPAASNYPFRAELDTALDTVQANIQQAINLGHQAGLQVYVATYFYLSPTGECKPTLLNVLLPAQAQRVNEYVRLLNDRIRTAATDARTVLVDVGARADEILADPANYSGCNHLSSQGNQFVAGIFQAAIQSQP